MVPPRWKPWLIPPKTWSSPEITRLMSDQQTRRLHLLSSVQVYSVHLLQWESWEEPTYSKQSRKLKSPCERHLQLFGGRQLQPTFGCHAGTVAAVLQTEERGDINNVCSMLSWVYWDTRFTSWARWDRSSAVILLAAVCWGSWQWEPGTCWGRRSLWSCFCSFLKHFLHLFNSEIHHLHEMVPSSCHCPDLSLEDNAMHWKGAQVLDLRPN